MENNGIFREDQNPIIRPERYTILEYHCIVKSQCLGPKVNSNEFYKITLLSLRSGKYVPTSKQQLPYMCFFTRKDLRILLITGFISCNFMTVNVHESLWELDDLSLLQILYTHTGHYQNSCKQKGRKTVKGQFEERQSTTLFLPTPLPQCLNTSGTSTQTNFT